MPTLAAGVVSPSVTVEARTHGHPFATDGADSPAG